MILGPVTLYQYETFKAVVPIALAKDNPGVRHDKSEVRVLQDNSVPSSNKSAGQLHGRHSIPHDHCKTTIIALVKLDCCMMLIGGC